MATILKRGKHLKVGADFVDATTNEVMRSHGTFEFGKSSRFTWSSTLPIAESERAIRRAAIEDGVHIKLFVSQAI